MPLKDSDITDWMSLIKLSEKEREEKQPSWPMLRKYFRGIQWQKDDEENDVVIVNLTFSHVKVIVPSTYLRNPKIYFEPNKPTAVKRARLMSSIFNGDMQRMGLKATNKRIIQDVVLLGTGFSKTTYEIENPAALEYPDDKEMVDQLVEDFHNVSLKSDVLEIPENGPRVVWVRPDDLTFSLGATDLSDLGFISHHVRKRLMAIKNDPYYKNTSDLQPTWIANDSKRDSQYYSEGASRYVEMVDLYEVWDMDTGTFFTIAEGHGKALREKEDIPYPYGHPFDRLTFTTLDDQMWGLSEVEMCIPQYDELNRLRTQQSQHVKRFNRKYVILENSFADEEEKNNLTSGEDGTIVTVRASVGNVANAVMALQDAPMTGDIYRYNTLIEDDVVKIAGITPYRRGGISGANTATEANIAEANSQTRDGDRRDYVSEFVLKQMAKVRKARREFTPGVAIANITDNPMDAPEWEQWRRSDIDLEMEMRIDYASTLPIDDNTKRQNALLLYDRALANPTVNPQSAFSALLDAFDERDQPKWFLPSELIKLQLLQKMMGAAQDQKGISPTAPVGGGEPGPKTIETSAELEGRAATR